MATFVLFSRMRLLCVVSIRGIAVRQLCTSRCNVFALALRRTCISVVFMSTVLLTHSATACSVLLVCTLCTLTLGSNVVRAWRTCLCTRWFVGSVLGLGLLPSLGGAVCLSCWTLITVCTSLKSMAVSSLPILRIAFMSSRFPTCIALFVCIGLLRCVRVVVVVSVRTDVLGFALWSPSLRSCSCSLLTRCTPCLTVLLLSLVLLLLLSVVWQVLSFRSSLCACLPLVVVLCTLPTASLTCVWSLSTSSLVRLPVSRTTLPCRSCSLVTLSLHCVTVCLSLSLCLRMVRCPSL